MENNSADKFSLGQGMVEIALILVLISGVVILSLNTFGIGVRETYCTVVQGLGNTLGCGCAFGFDDASDIENWDAKDKYQGQFTVENGKACIDGKGQNTASFLNSCSSDFGNDDFILSMDDLTTNEIYESNKNNGYDFWFRAQDEKNGYHFTYTSKGDAIRFWKRVNGKWIRLAHKKVDPAEWQGTTYKLEIKVEGDTFTAYKDGEAVLQAKDSAYQEGSVGIRTKPDSKTCIDSMTVRRP